MSTRKRVVMFSLMTAVVLAIGFGVGWFFIKKRKPAVVTKSLSESCKRTTELLSDELRKYANSQSKYRKLDSLREELLSMNCITQLRWSLDKERAILMKAGGYPFHGDRLIDLEHWYTYTDEMDGLATNKFHSLFALPYKWNDWRFSRPSKYHRYNNYHGHGKPHRMGRREPSPQ